MNNTEAKFVLGAYRTNGGDANDPAMAAALAQVKSDPALAEWFKREQAHAAQVAAKLREIAPPAGLRDAILAGGQASGGGESVASRAWWRRPQWLTAVAAAVALGAGAALWWPVRSAANPGDLMAFAANDTAGHFMHGGHGDANAALQAALSEPARKLGAGLPVNFATLRDTGCRTLTVGGHDVLEVCFKRDGQWFHCYMARRADFPALERAAAPEFAQRGKMAVTAWADAAYVYVVASPAAMDAVKRLL
jgi:hypothetical protein